MMRREGDALILDGPVTLQTVAELVGAAEEHFREGAQVVDFSGVTEVDSSAIALALEWQRQAAKHERTLRFEALPAAMQNLARLYGVSEILQLSTV
jgi:phospholipid transport system transporter-binding protein